MAFVCTVMRLRFAWWGNSLVLTALVIMNRYSVTYSCVCYCCIPSTAAAATTTTTITSKTTSATIRTAVSCRKYGKHCPYTLLYHTLLLYKTTTFEKLRLFFEPNCSRINTAHCQPQSHFTLPPYENGTDRVFRNVGIESTDGGELP
jgi:hypothetical protein